MYIKKVASLPGGHIFATRKFMEPDSFLYNLFHFLYGYWSC